MPVRVGYLNGIAVVIVIGQLPKLFGFTVESGGLAREAAGFLRGVADGRTNATALALRIEDESS